jgi:hypothetical protein
MPLVSYEGLDTADLERAVADVERGKGRVVQVVGNMAGSWWLLVEKPARKPAAARETRA